MSLETSIERVRLLKAGFSGKEIENLYVTLNNFTILGEAATNPEDLSNHIITPVPSGVRAASPEVSA